MVVGAAPLALSRPAMAAQSIAVLTQVSGSVVVRQGAKQIPAKAGMTLSAGDRVETRGGSATVFYLNGAQRRLTGKSTLVIALAAKNGNVSLMRGAYVGLSQGLASGGGRLAATMREGTLEPVAPLDTALLDDKGVFRWRLGKLDKNAITGYEVEVLNANRALARFRTARTELPLTALQFPRDTVLRWRVTPYGKVGAVGKTATAQPILLWRSRDVSFSVASAATLHNLRLALAGIDQNSQLAPEKRRLARAALLSGRRFYDAAQQELQGLNIPEAQALRLALRPVGTATTGKQTPRIKDEALERDVSAKDVLTSRSLKLYTDPYGKFSIRIPVSWGYESSDLGGGTRQTLWAARPLSSPRLSVSLAPRATASATPLVERLWKASKGQVTTSTPQKVTWYGRQVERQYWKAKFGIITLQGTSWAWSEKGMDIVASVGEFPGDAVYTRQLGLCLGSLQINAAPAKKNPTPNPWDNVSNDSLLADMRAINAQSSQIDIAQEVTQGETNSRARGQKVTPGDFERYRTSYVAQKQTTPQKSQAASQASGIAAALGWQAIQTNRLTDAKKWFARRTAFADYAYENAIALCRARLAANEVQIQRLRAATPPVAFANRLNALLDMRLSLQQSYILTAQTLAYNHNDAKRNEEFARMGWRVVCERIDNKALGGVYTSAAPNFAAGDKALAAFDDEWRLNRRVDASDILVNLCEAALLDFDFERATAFGQRALAWKRALPTNYVKRDESGILRKLALIADRSGDYTLARARYETLIKALQQGKARQEAYIATREDPDQRLLQRTGMIQDRVLAFNNLGLVLNNLSDFDTSRAYYTKALDLLETPDKDVVNSTRPADLLGQASASLTPLPKTGPTSEAARQLALFFKQQLRATVLGNIANLELSQGNLDASLKLYDEASKLLLSIGMDESAAVALFNRSGVFYERDQLVDAAKTMRTAHDIFVQLQDTKYLAAITWNLARIERLNGRLDKADELGVRALGLARLSNNADNVSNAATALAAIRIDRWQAQPDGAQKNWLLTSVQALLREADAANARSDISDSVRATLATRASLQEAQGDLKGALETLKAALARVEAVRANANSEKAYSNLRAVSDLYERTVRLQLRLGLNTDAFDTLSRSRSKRLFDTLSLSNLDSPDPELQGLLDRAAQLENKKAQLRSQIQAETSVTDGSSDSNTLETLRDLLAATEAEYRAVSSRIASGRPGLQKALTVSPQTLKASQAAIPEGALLLQYAPIGQKLYIFAITRKSLKIYTPPTSAASVIAQTRAMRKALDAQGQRLAQGNTAPALDRDTAFLKASVALYTTLVAPVANEWKQAKIVAIIPEGELYYLPFHALGHRVGTGFKFWLEETPLTYLMGADVLGALREQNALPQGTAPKGGVLAMGDPPGADLPAARAEVLAVARLFPASQALIGESATKGVLVQNKALRKRAIHLAAHGVLDPMRPDRSFIQLAPDATKGDDGKLRISEIYGLNLKGVNLVTLSACQTALGVLKPNGTEITSLAESFASAGTPSVVASLWNVEDTSTSALMKKFYGGLADGKTKAESLRAAQLALLKNPATRHPFFWAPFELLGDWR